jgi:signal transduction histidine kinase
VSPAPRANIDPHRLQQCLTALVDNALLYSDGPVTLAASSGPAGELVLHVIDRGPGTAGLASPHPGGGADFQLLLPGLG